MFWTYVFGEIIKWFDKSCIKISIENAHRKYCDYDFCDEIKVRGSFRKQFHGRPIMVIYWQWLRQRIELVNKSSAHFLTHHTHTKERRNVKAPKTKLTGSRKD